MEEVNEQVGSIAEELARIRTELAEAKRRWHEAERTGMSVEYRIALLTPLVELQKKENALLTARRQGKAPIALFPFNYLTFCSFRSVLLLLFLILFFLINLVLIFYILLSI
jgi:hypothetical protein